MEIREQVKHMERPKEERDKCPCEAGRLSEREHLNLVQKHVASENALARAHEVKLAWIKVFETATPSFLKVIGWLLFGFFAGPPAISQLVSRFPL